MGKPYRDLAKILESKDYFVLTTNVDGQAQLAFPADRIFSFQGDLRFWQCSQPCVDEPIDNGGCSRDLVAATYLNHGIPRIDEALLPRCPECGHLMAPWVRDERFLEGASWHEEESRYREFLIRHLVEKEDAVLFLELGVSSMTPAIIKMPFWSMCAQNPRTRYVCVNKGETAAPKHLGERAAVVTADLALVMESLAAR